MGGIKKLKDLISMWHIISFRTKSMGFFVALCFAISSVGVSFLPPPQDLSIALGEEVFFSLESNSLLFVLCLLYASHLSLLASRAWIRRKESRRRGFRLRAGVI